MKKFLIISIVLLLISGSIFGYSLSQHPLTLSPSAETEESQEKATEPAAPASTASPGDELNINPDSMNTGGIFSAYYEKASNYVAGMSKEQLVGQMIISVADNTAEAATDVNRYYLGGVQFLNESFDYMSKDEVKNAVAAVRTAATTSPILAVQEEGGRRNAVSSHAAFEDVTFDSPRDTYDAGGIAAVERLEDTKTTFLKELGFNLNLAPVLDLAKEYDQIMYSRSLCGDAQITSTYAEYVAKFNQAKGVSVALKHFPGYGTINDTADLVVVDHRDAATIRSEDYLPFKAGAAAGAHFVMISNVVVENIDAAHTAALSPTLHRELRENIGFTGLIITDVLDAVDYSAYSDGRDVYVAAVLAGNDLILAEKCSDAYNAILSAVDSGTISETILRQVCTRIIAYKYAAGLMQ